MNPEIDNLQRAVWELRTAQAGIVRAKNEVPNGLEWAAMSLAGGYILRAISGLEERIAGLRQSTMKGAEKP